MLENLNENAVIKPVFNYDNENDPKAEINMSGVPNTIDLPGTVGITTSIIETMLNNQIGIIAANLPDGLKLIFEITDGEFTEASITVFSTTAGMAIGSLMGIKAVGEAVKKIPDPEIAKVAEWFGGQLLSSLAGILVDHIIYYLTKTYYSEIVYKEEYDQARSSGDIIINAGITGLDDIKNFLQYSGVFEIECDEEPVDVYVKQGDKEYLVVRGSDYNSIVSELQNRGFWNETQYGYLGISNQLYELNTANQWLEDQEGFAVSTVQPTKFLLLDTEKLFPYQGNDFDNKIYSYDNKDKTPDTNTFYGLGGSDTVEGGYRGETIYGDYGAGWENIYSENGATRPVVGPYSMSLWGDDVLTGNGGSDVIYGGEGDDSIYGDQESIVLAADGNDWLYGEAGNDYIVGGNNDTLVKLLSRCDSPKKAA